MKHPDASAQFSEEFLRRVVASSPDCIQVLDLDGHLLSMNDGGQKLLEIVDLTPHLGSCWTGWWDGEAEQAAQAAVEEARRGGTGQFEAFAKTFGGAPKWWDVTVSPIPGTDGRPEKLLSVSRDVTRRKLAEQELAEAQARITVAAETERSRLASVFKHSPSFMAVLRGPEHVFELVNDRYLQLVGHRDLLHKPVRDALPEVAEQGFLELLDKVYTTGVPFIGQDRRIVLQREMSHPQEERFLDFVYQPTFEGDGSISGILVHGVDRTERKTAEAALMYATQQVLASERSARSEAERTSRMKDEFLATLSHELRTPLNAILGWTQVLRGDPANSADVESGLATIERNARVQNDIIEDLLDMSRIISGKVRLNVERIDLAAVVEAAVETVRPAATAKNIRLQPVIDQDARMVNGDPNRLQQVFWNLLTNAIKFTPKGGSVQVVLERIHSHLEVNVIDSGEGIDPEFLPYVFDRFRQADASTTRKHGGLGLGLAIVKQLVELHGGSVHADSLGLGQGTTFRVMLPLMAVWHADVHPDAERHHPLIHSTPPTVPAEALRLAGVRVLVVDDEADARALVKRLLEDRGARVRTAGSVVEAMELLRAETPDVLVSDIGMPEQDGYALIQQVRALPAGHGGGVPALALTAYARSEDRTKAILAGYQMHTAKPVEAVELLVLVANLASRTGGNAS